MFCTGIGDVNNLLYNNDLNQIENAPPLREIETTGDGY